MTWIEFLAIVALLVLINIHLMLIDLHIQEANGANYIYNASESEIRDQWVTEACIRLQINSPECDMVYGGIMDKISEGKIK